MQLTHRKAMAIWKEGLAEMIEVKEITEIDYVRQYISENILATRRYSKLFLG